MNLAASGEKDGKPRTAPGLLQLLPLPYGWVKRSRRDPLGFLADGWRRFGDLYRYQIGPWRFFVALHPNHVRQVLQENWRNYPRSWLYGFTKLVIGDGLVSTEGEVWRRQRRMVQPGFSQQRVFGMAGMMTDATEVMLRRWETIAQSGHPIDMAEQMIDLTLRIVGKTLLAADFSQDSGVIGEAVAEALGYIEHRINHLVAPPIWFPTRRNRRFRRAMRTMDQVVYDVVRARRNAPDAGDLLSMLLNARDEETGAAMTDLEVRNQVMTFIGAGHETTAVLLAWVWHLLSKHPTVEEAARAEVDTALDGRTPTPADLPNLPLVRRIIDEALRLYPPVHAAVRDVKADDAIDGYRIPAGSSVVVCSYLTHRHPEFWPDAERFDPDRFLPEAAAKRSRFAYFPFLGGPHQCIGQDFALMEATLIVAMVLQRFRLRDASPEPIRPTPLLSLRPGPRLMMRIERR